MDLAPLNLGMIASYYYITYTTIELFANSLTPKTKVKGLLEIVAAASEFDSLPMRPGEENVVEKMLRHAAVSVDKPRYSDPHTKVNALLQAHFSRERLSGDLANDTRTSVKEAARLLQVGVTKGILLCCVSLSGDGPCCCVKTVIGHQDDAGCMMLA